MELGCLLCRCVKQIQEGTLEGWKLFRWLRWRLGIDELSENASAEAKDLINEAKAKIEAGELNIFEGPIKDQTGAVRVEEGQILTDEEMLQIDYLIEGVEGVIEQ